MASKTQNVAVAIKSIEFDKNGQLVIVGQPNDFNPKGTYVMNAAQEQRLLQRVGLSQASTLKHMVALSNGTSKLEYVASFNKQGEAWDNGKTGTARKSGTFDKDWIGLGNHEIQLGFAAKQKIADVALQLDLAGDIRNRRPVVTPEKVVITPEDNGGATPNV